jgi:hypothetical protein
MGFTGCLVVLRHQTPPTELVGGQRFQHDDSVCTLPVADPRGWSGDEVAWSDGWRVWQYFGQLPAGYARALMDAASVPVLTGHVLHSDATRVEGLGPRTGRWAAWQMVWRAVDYFDVQVDFDADELTDEECRERYEQAERDVAQRLLADAPGGPATARQAVAWAEEAGLVASADAVLAALDGHRTFAEELFFDLLGSLGIKLIT